VLEFFLPPAVRFIGDEDAGQQFLANRLRVEAFQNQPRGDSARLQNIVRFLTDMEHAPAYMNSQGWTSDSADSIRRERRELFDTRRTEEYRTGRITFDQHGNRASPEFMPAAQQDLITLTLEILARDSVATAASEQREAFGEACRQLRQVVSEHAWQQARIQTQRLPESSPTVLEARAFANVQAKDSIQMVKRALKPVLDDLQVQLVEPTPHPHVDDAAASASQMPVAQGSSALLEIVCPEDTPDPAPVGPALRPTPSPLLIFQHSMSSSAGPETAMTDLGNSPEKLSPGPSRK